MKIILTTIGWKSVYVAKELGIAKKVNESWNINGTAEVCEVQPKQVRCW